MVCLNYFRHPIFIKIKSVIQPINYIQKSNLIALAY